MMRGPSQSQSLRLLVVGLQWPPETFLTQLFRRLAERGISVTLASPERPDSSWRSIANIDIFYSPGWDNVPSQRLWRVGHRLVGAMSRSAVQTRQIIDAARSSGNEGRFLEQFHRWLPHVGREWDVVYIPWNSMAIEFLPLMDLYPTVISCRGTQINVSPLNPERSDFRDGLALTFCKAAAVHCVSAAIRDEAEKYGLDRAKATVIRPAVDSDLFHPLGDNRKPDGAFKVVSTGAVNWIKGYEYALLAVRKLRDRGIPVRYDVIGSGRENQRLLYTIRDLELEDCVVWHGHLAPELVRARLQSADVFLLSSLAEGISNAVLEGMACGLPVVSTQVGGMSEAITDGFEGFMVPSLDAMAMVVSLEKLWQDTELRHRMGAAGRARVLRHFQLEDQAGAFAEVLRSVV